MLFNSFEFIIFFVVVTALYYILPFKTRWLMLLLASCTFYMYFIPVYILILFLTIFIDYYAGIFIEKYPKNKKSLLILSIVSNVGILMFFKYFNFFAENLNVLADKLNWNYSIGLLEIILPIGLSFHTFQAMSYTIEVYRGNQRAEKHIGIYALYVMYYPQLVAGPIERPQNVLHQFHQKHKFNLKLFNNGLMLMLWGFFKKVVIADRIAYYINPVFDHPESYQGISIFVAAILFSFQIFCDFSGYSDIAIGASQTMGIKLMTNFNRPYSSKTIAEFWSRWHISLSTWFKDYLYIPLGGNRVPKIIWYRNIFIVFLISGFWHGANWTFLIWGALHGIYQIVGIETSQIRSKIFSFFRLSNTLLYSMIQKSTVFVLVTLAWIFFRADTLDKALFMTKKFIFSFKDYFSNLFAHANYRWLEPLMFDLNVKTVYMEFLVLFITMVILEYVHSKQVNVSWLRMFNSKPTWLKWAISISLVLFIMIFGMFHNEAEFIYFQF